MVFCGPAAERSCQSPAGGGNGEGRPAAVVVLAALPNAGLTARGLAGGAAALAIDGIFESAFAAVLCARAAAAAASGADAADWVSANPEAGASGGGPARAGAGACFSGSWSGACRANACARSIKRGNSESSAPSICARSNARTARDGSPRLSRTSPSQRNASACCGSIFAALSSAAWARPRSRSMYQARPSSTSKRPCCCSSSTWTLTKTPRASP